MSDSAHLPPICFIVGCPRSGTYLVSAILNQSGVIAIPSETHFVPLFLRWHWLAGNLDRSANRRRLIEAIFSFLRIWLARAEEERDFGGVTRHSLLTVGSEADRIAESTHDYPELVQGLFAAYARTQGAAMAGDKSAFFDHMPLEHMDAAVGGRARFIHIVRDGRDVCLSWMKIKVGPRSRDQAARTWAQHVAGKRAWGTRHPDRYHELRYEDLLAEPEHTLRAVCRFAGIPYSAALLDFHAAPYARDIANSSTHGRLSQPLDPGNCGKWRTEMTPGEVAVFEAIAGPELTNCGYPLAGSPSTATRFESRTTVHFSIHRLRLALKSFLPACTLIAVRLHVPLDRICNSRLWLRMESWLAKRHPAPRPRAASPPDRRQKTVSG